MIYTAIMTHKEMTSNAVSTLKTGVDSWYDLRYKKVRGSLSFSQTEYVLVDEASHTPPHVVYCLRNTYLLLILEMYRSVLSKTKMVFPVVRVISVMIMMMVVVVVVLPPRVTLP